MICPSCNGDTVFRRGLSASMRMMLGYVGGPSLTLLGGLLAAYLYVVSKMAGTLFFSQVSPQPEMAGYIPVALGLSAAGLLMIAAIGVEIAWSFVRVLGFRCHVCNWIGPASDLPTRPDASRPSAVMVARQVALPLGCVASLVGFYVMEEGLRVRPLWFSVPLLPNVLLVIAGYGLIMSRSWGRGVLQAWCGYALAIYGGWFALFFLLTPRLGLGVFPGPGTCVPLGFALVALAVLQFGPSGVSGVQERRKPSSSPLRKLPK